MPELSVDFETHSAVNINTDGAYRYAMDPSTGIYTMSWAFDDEPAQCWVPGRGDEFPQRVIDHIKAGGIINAFNATFERLIFWYVLCPDYDVPEPELEQFHCTAAKSRTSGLPGKLADACRALDLPLQKMTHGTRLIREYCAENIPWHRIPEDDQYLMIEYCDRDVETERMVGACVRELTDYEWEEYHLNETINDRGIPVDVPMANAALGYAEAVRAEVDDKIAELTEYKVTTARKRKSRDEWLFPQLDETMMAAITRKAERIDEETGEVIPAKYSLDEEHRQALRVVPGLPDPVLQYLDLLDEAGGATIAKYAAMKNMEIDGRVNGTIMFNGAGQTGRFSSLKLQAHNLRRDSLDDPEPVIEDLLDLYELDEPTTTLARLVRAAIYRPQGLTWYDFSAIEGRVAPWLEGGPLGEAKLDLYREGVDPYVYNATKTFNCAMEEVTSQQRQGGKVQELALQFLGGTGALRVFARNYGLYFTEEEAQVMVDRWRDANPWARNYGNDLDRAALLAVRNPERWFKAGRVRFYCDGGDWLWMELPSGRWLSYYQPDSEMVETPWGEERMAVTVLWGSGKPKKGEQWPRRAYHGGMWIENATQATAADLLREAIVRSDDAGLDVVLHVHDEIVVEGYHETLLGKIMLTLPTWAEGLPLEGAGGMGTRYGK